MSEYLPLYRELRKMLEIVMRARRFQFSQLEGKGHPHIVELSIATEGFGLLGERAPVTEDNVKSVSRMYTLLNIFSHYAEDERDLLPFKELLKEAETLLYARSHRRDTLIAPLADVLSRSAIKFEQAAFVEGGEEGGERAKPARRSEKQ